MKAGKLKHRVTVKRINRDARNEFNEVEPVEVTVAEVWANVKPIKQAERLYGGQVTADTTHLVSMRYNELVNGHPDYFLVVNGRTLQITGIVNVDEANKELEISATEGDQ